MPHDSQWEAVSASPTKATEKHGLTQTSGQASCTDYIQVGAEVAPTALTCGPGFLTVFGTEHT